MSNPQWDKLWEIFHEVTAAQEADRASLLSRLCGDDLALRAEVESLVASHDRDGGALDRPLVDLELDASGFAPPAQVGPYRLGEPVGRGGMGEVFAAERTDGEFRQTVAVKFATSARYSPALLQRFIAERQILSDLNHPAIARLIDGGATAEGIAYLVMEFVDGQPVDQYCDGADLGLGERLRLFCAICQAVHYAHQNLVIHRDIKPGNILVDGSGQPKLLDFGVAKLLTASASKPGLTAALGPVATPEYASPEQLRSDPITTATDVYALGVLLFQLLTGARPFPLDGANMEELVRRVCDQPAPSPSQSIDPDCALARRTRQLPARLRGDLDRIVLKALRKEPERRYPSAEQLAHDIERFLAGLPVRAQPDTAGYRLRKLVARHPLGALASVTALAALVAFSVVNLRQARDLQLALDQARVEQGKSEQVSRFMEDLFRVSDPLLSDRGEPTARTLLEEGRDRLDQALAGQPELRGAMLVTLGTVYANLSDHDTAESLLRDAIAAIGDHASRDAVRARIALGRSLYEMDRYDEARHWLEQALVSARTLEPPEPILISEAELRLGRNYQAQSKFDQAQGLIEQGLARRRAAVGDQDVAVADAYRLLGGVLWRRGEYEQATGPHRRAYDLHRQVLGDDHHATLESRTALGLLMLRLGQLEAARGHMEAVRNARLDRLGPDHALTAESRNRLGALYYEMGLFDQANAELLEATRVLEDRFGFKSAKLARALNNLALVRQFQRDLEGAAELFERILAIHVETVGEAHYLYASALNNLGFVRYDQGRFEVAQADLERALSLLEAIYGPDNPRLVYVLTNLGRTLHARGGFQAAADCYLRARELQRQHLDTDHPATGLTLTALGELRLDQGDPVAATVALEEALSVRTRSLPEGDWRIAETRHHLGLALLAAGDSERGAALSQSGFRVMSETLGRDHWRVRQAAQRLQALGWPGGQPDDIAASPKAVDAGG